MSDRYANKRARFRKGGRFARPPTLEQMGFDVAHEPATCSQCGHVWQPVLVSGLCPVCATPANAGGTLP